MINYHFLDQSTYFYEQRGYKRIESPWTVTEAISNITKPPGAKNLSIKEKDKVLVASGEQSFLYLYLKGFLPKGRFQTITPCFRDEVFDNCHTKYFMKNELIDTENVTEVGLREVVKDAVEFFNSILKVGIDLVTTPEGYDLECGGIELGSYGIRNCDFLRWIYGTGCAEPRLSYVEQRIYGLSQS